MNLEELLDWLYDAEIDLKYIGKRPLKVCIMYDYYVDDRCPSEMTKQEVIDLWNQTHQEAE